MSVFWKTCLYTVWNEVEFCNAHVTSIIARVPNAAGMTYWSGGIRAFGGRCRWLWLAFEGTEGDWEFLFPTVTWRECLESQLAVWSIWPTQTGAGSDVVFRWSLAIHQPAKLINFIQKVINRYYEQIFNTFSAWQNFRFFLVQIVIAIFENVKKHYTSIKKNINR